MKKLIKYISPQEQSLKYSCNGKIKKWVCDKVRRFKLNRYGGYYLSFSLRGKHLFTINECQISWIAWPLGDKIS